MATRGVPPGSATARPLSSRRPRVMRSSSWLQFSVACRSRTGWLRSSTRWIAQGSANPGMPSRPAGWASIAPTAGRRSS